MRDEFLQGRYRIIRQLAAGGMGAVYEARDERLGSVVAVKEVIFESETTNLDQQEKIRRAFEREAKILARLRHESFPRVTDYFSDNGRQFLIMELVNGVDLGEQINKTQNPFPFINIVKIAEQLLDALDYLHNQSPPTYHRDIKPQNLKISARGKLKILDFGIAKSVDPTGSTVVNQTFIGATLNYSPIEQALPTTPETFREFIIWKFEQNANFVLSQNTDARCDLYAVGATIYHLSTNQPPVDSTKRCLKIWEGEPDPLIHPQELNSALSPSFSAWILKSMAIDREHRFSSAIEMKNALQKIVSNDENKIDLSVNKPIQPPQTQQYAPISEPQSFNTVLEIKPEPLDEFIAKYSSPSIQTDVSPSKLTSENLPITSNSNYVEIPNSNSPNSSNSVLIPKPFNENTAHQNQPVSFVSTNTNAKTVSKFIWLIPIVAIGFLALLGIIGGAIWFSLKLSK